MTTLLAPPVVDDATRREFLAVLGAAGLLTGCASDPATSEDGSRTRSVEHPLGTTQLPDDPQRIAALYTHDLDNALVLGLPVVAGGSPAPLAERPFPDYLYAAFAEQAERIAAVDSTGQLNLEQLAAISPDAIVGAADFIEPDQYQLLTAIAPTGTYSYFTDKDAGVVVPWREALRGQAAMFGREEVSEEFGLEPAVFVTRPDFEVGELSYELLGEIDADLLLLEGDPRDRAGMDAVASQPLWSSVPAVVAGQVYETDQVLAYESALAAMAFLDVIEGQMLA